MTGKKLFCLKCKSHRIVKNPKRVIKNGRTFLQGKCNVCGSKMSKIAPKRKGGAHYKILPTFWRGTSGKFGNVTGMFGNKGELARY